MWEYTITLPSSKNEQAQKLKNDLQSAVKELGGVITMICTPKDITILIAVKVEHKMAIKSKIINLICNFIILDYKYNYLVSNFKFKVTNDINMQAFIKALVVFDSEIDKEIIRQKIKDYDSVVIESFFTFRLGILKKKWQDLVSLANDNFVYLMKSETFIELLKFIISNLEYRTKEVNVKYKHNSYLLCDSNNKPINDVMLGDTRDYGDAFLVTALITLCPQKIRLHCDTNIQSSTINLLFELFSDRIEILK